MLWWFVQRLCALFKSYISINYDVILTCGKYRHKVSVLRSHDDLCFDIYLVVCIKNILNIKVIELVGNRTPKFPYLIGKSTLSYRTKIRHIFFLY